MSDIFLSYDSSDRAVAHIFADALEARGWSVWWDREIPLGKRFDEVIEHELMSAACVIVLWSKQSVRSRWVRTEASAAAGRECLLPVAIEDTPIPLEFRHIQTAMLAGWSGDTNDAEFERLTQAIEMLLTRSAATHTAPPPLPLTPAPAAPPTRAKRWQTHPAVAAVAVLAVLLAAVAMLNRPGDDGSNNDPASSGALPGPSGGTPAVSSGTVAPASDPAPPASDPAPPSPGPVEASTGGGAVSGAFRLTTSGRIAEGVPGAGAGVIESVGSTDVYVFEARPGHRVYFHVVQVANALGGARWKLTDAEGMAIFDTCLSCTTPGLQRLLRGGRYTLTVGENGSATGAYELRLFDVPPPDRFALAIGDTVQDDQPGSGAGAIDTPGAEDIFTFTAAPRERLYFRMLEHGPAAGGLRWQLTDSDGTEVFNTCLGCSEPGVQRLSKGGEYTLTVGSATNVGTGSYRLRITRVPAPQQFAIEVPARIAAGVPGAGAGMIEVPGAEDVYVFNAAARQELRFRSVEHDQAIAGIRWRLVDHNGNEIFNTCLGCSNPSPQRLSAGGRYELIVGNTGHAATGAYAIAVEPVR